MAMTPKIGSYVLPGKAGATSQPNATDFNLSVARQLMISRLRDEVQKQLLNKCDVLKIMPMDTLTGTATIRLDAFGGGGIGKLTRGVEIETQQYKYGKLEMSVDTPLIARAVLGKLDMVQDRLNSVAMIGKKQGEDLARFIDQTYIIQCIKAALMTDTPFVDMRGLEGFGGGTRVTLGAAADATDPAKLFNAFRRLEADMYSRNVDLKRDNSMILVSPATMLVLESNEMLVDRQIKWSDGTDLQGHVLRNLGIPIMRSNQFVGGKNITNHHLSNTSNGNAYDVDATKVLAVTVSPDALQDGWAWKPEHDVHYSQVDKVTYVDTSCAMGVGVARPEFAGAILLP